ncbi:hypothetical protein GGR56DRAFT_628811 [Xylariaceae sp. FL0804]|nr:hypothetical protein GGR56DRAFT_628811 [Xylariaceae sp. FL0804]
MLLLSPLHTHVVAAAAPPSTTNTATTITSPPTPTPSAYVRSTIIAPLVVLSYRSTAALLASYPVLTYSWRSTGEECKEWMRERPHKRSVAISHCQAVGRYLLLTSVRYLVHRQLRRYTFPIYFLPTPSLSFFSILVVWPFPAGAVLPTPHSLTIYSPTYQYTNVPPTS